MLAPESQMRTIGRAASGLAVIVFALVAWFHIRTAVTSTVQFDDAFIANVAKSLAAGEGYSASYYGLHPFHLEITTGPVLIFPAAAMMRIWGSGYWVPGIAYTAVVAVCLALFVAAMKRSMDRESRAVACSAIALVLFAFGMQEIGLLGEVPAALLIAAAALTLTAPRRDPPTAPELAGLLLAMAILAKAVAALAFPVFIAAIVRSPLFAERRTIALRQFVLCLAFPIVAFEAWKLSMLGGNAAAWSRLVFAEVADVVGPNAALSGSATLTEALLRPAAVLTNLRTHAPIAAAWFGGSRDPLLAPIWWKGWAPGAALLLSVGLALRNVSRSTCADVPAAVVVSSRILLGVGAVSLAWWLTLAPMGWVRHLLPGLLCGLIGLALLLAVCARTRPRTTALAAALLLVALAPNLVSVAHPFASVSELRSDLRTGLHPVPRLAALLRTADYLHRIEAADSGLRLVGCGWSHNPSLEYLMPGSDHFRDCILVRGRELNGRRLVLVRGEYFNQARSPEIERFQRWCEEHVLFQALHFVVSECSGPPPEAPWY